MTKRRVNYLSSQVKRPAKAWRINEPGQFRLCCHMCCRGVVRGCAAVARVDGEVSESTYRRRALGWMLSHKLHHSTLAVILLRYPVYRR